MPVWEKSSPAGVKDSGDREVGVCVGTSVRRSNKKKRGGEGENVKGL